MKTKSKIIPILQRKYPKQIWKCIRNGFGSWEYVTDDGWTAGYRSCLVSMHPDDMDGHHMLRFFVYQKDKVDEIDELNSGMVYEIW